MPKAAHTKTSRDTSPYAHIITEREERANARKEREAIRELVEKTTEELGLTDNETNKLVLKLASKAEKDKIDTFILEKLPEEARAKLTENAEQIAKQSGADRTKVESALKASAYLTAVIASGSAAAAEAATVEGPILGGIVSALGASVATFTAPNANLTNAAAPGTATFNATLAATSAPNSLGFGALQACLQEYIAGPAAAAINAAIGLPYGDPTACTGAVHTGAATTSIAGTTVSVNALTQGVCSDTGATTMASSLAAVAQQTCGAVYEQMTQTTQGIGDNSGFNEGFGWGYLTGTLATLLVGTAIYLGVHRYQTESWDPRK